MRPQQRGSKPGNDLPGLFFDGVIASVAQVLQINRRG